jgi:hypothetical protein
MTKTLSFVLAVLPCFAQVDTLRVFSEFTRIDPFGQIVPEDHGSAEPRHILSPGVPRNAFSSLRIVVSFDKPGKYILDIGQNPENAVKATLYKEKFEKAGDRWIPDGLVPVKIPYESSFPEEGVPGQTVVTFWLDMWVARTAPVDRIKVEPQLWLSTADDWFTYPMEVRILETVIPNLTASTATLPAVTDRSDAAAIAPLRAAFCATPEPPGQQAVSARSLVRRNALQLTARKHPASTAHLLQASKAPTIAAWCADPVKSTTGPEWLLRFRDLENQRELK